MNQNRDIDPLLPTHNTGVFSFDRAGTGETALPRRRPVTWQAAASSHPQHTLPVTTRPNRLDDTTQHAPSPTWQVVGQTGATPPLPVRAPWRSAVAYRMQPHEQRALLDESKRMATIGLDAQEKATAPDRTIQTSMFTMLSGIWSGEDLSHPQMPANLQPGPKQHTVRQDEPEAKFPTPASQPPLANQARPRAASAEPLASIPDNYQDGETRDREVFRRILSSYDTLASKLETDRPTGLAAQQDGGDVLVAEIGRYREEVSAILGWRTLSLQYRTALGSYPAHLERDEKENSFALTITVGEREAGENLCQAMVAHGQSCWLRERIGPRRTVPPPIVL